MSSDKGRAADLPCGSKSRAVWVCARLRRGFAYRASEVKLRELDCLVTMFADRVEGLFGPGVLGRADSRAVLFVDERGQAPAARCRDPWLRAELGGP